MTHATRLALVALAAGVLGPGAGPAGAQERGSIGLTRTANGGEEITSTFALAGDEALLDRGDGVVVGLPIVAGGAATERARVTVPPDGRVAYALSGDATGAAAAVQVETRRQAFGTGQLLSAPLEGPLGPVTAPVDLRRGYATVLVQRDEGRIFSVEYRLARRGIRARTVVREPGRPPRKLVLTALESLTAVFAGELVAYTAPHPGDASDSEERTLVLAAWRSGRLLRRIVLPDGVETLDLRADGSVAVGLDAGGVLEVRPDRARPRIVSKDGVRPVFASDAIVYVRDGDELQRLVIARRGRRSRPIGPPSQAIGGPVADGRRVLHSANGCLLATGLGAPATTAPVDGPCPRGEIKLPTKQGNPTLHRDGRLSVLLRCVAAEAAGCVGTAELRLDDLELRAVSPVSIRIRPGRERRVTFRLSRRVAEAARRDARQGIGGTGIEVRARITDSAGRVSTLEDIEAAVPEELGGGG